MNRQRALKILNPLLALLALALFVSGYGRRSLPYWAFEVFHEGAAGLLVLGIVLHLVLNWGWIKNTYIKR